MTGEGRTSTADHVPAWVADAVFYQIFPDRFARSEGVGTAMPLEPWESPPTTHGFKGGDLYGVVEKLDYLEDLGVNALYLNPIFASASTRLSLCSKRLRSVVAHTGGCVIALDGIPEVAPHTPGPGK